MPGKLSARSNAPVKRRSPRSNFFCDFGSCALLRYSQFRAACPRIRALFVFARFERFRSNQVEIVIWIRTRLGPFRLVQPFTTVIAEEIFHYAILERMKRDHCDARTGLQPRGQSAKPFPQCAEFVVDLHP